LLVSIVSLSFRSDGALPSVPTFVSLCVIDAMTGGRLCRLALG
jgi:hypothetical protein